MADPVGGSEVMSQNGVSSHVDGFLGPLKICWAYPPLQAEGPLQSCTCPCLAAGKGKELVSHLSLYPF